MGEASMIPTRPLAAWPLPYRGGDLNVSFGIFGHIGQAGGDADVALYDLAGRRVRTLARGRFEGGQQIVVWDGRDDAGHPVASGIYFLRSRSGSEETSVKVTVIR